MKEETITKVTTETVIALEHDDLENILKDRFCDNENTEWSFNFNFNLAIDEVKIKIIKKTTETKRKYKEV